ncbi:hypothetical protein [Chitinimonas lacunae]|uniref:DUF4329 domain-containing protein n=1 Tax=Chitinimonas lacunae TaxID=1963018 RepID=A0ABV8MKW7_9NEIS
MNLAEKHKVEFATTYTLGPGKNGGGGYYTLYSGGPDSVSFGELAGNKILINHVHPGGTPVASGYYMNGAGERVFSPTATDISSGAVTWKGDQAALQKLIDAGSPQRTSVIIPAEGRGGIYQPPFRFSTTSKNLDYSISGDNVVFFKDIYNRSAGPKGYLP